MGGRREETVNGWKGRCRQSYDGLARRDSLILLTRHDHLLFYPLLQNLLSVMSTLDNANPTIHSAAASSSSGIFGAASRRVGAGGGASRTVRDLWAEEGADDFYQEALEQDGSAGGDDAGDDIDAEEIFGALLCPQQWLS